MSRKFQSWCIIYRDTLLLPGRRACAREGVRTVVRCCLPRVGGVGTSSERRPTPMQDLALNIPPSAVDRCRLLNASAPARVGAPAAPVHWVPLSRRAVPASRRPVAASSARQTSTVRRELSPTDERPPASAKHESTGLDLQQQRVTSDHTRIWRWSTLSAKALSARQLPQRCTQDWCSRSVMFA